MHGGPAFQSEAPNIFVFYAFFCGDSGPLAFLRG